MYAEGRRLENFRATGRSAPVVALNEVITQFETLLPGSRVLCTGAAARTEINLTEVCREHPEAVCVPSYTWCCPAREEDGEVRCISWICAKSLLRDEE